MSSVVVVWCVSRSGRRRSCVGVLRSGVEMCVDVRARASGPDWRDDAAKFPTRMHWSLSLYWLDGWGRMSDLNGDTRVFVWRV